MAAKMVTDRQRMARQVLAAIDAHGGEVAAGLAAEVGEAAAGTAALQRALRRRLEERLEALVRADEEHLDAVGDLVGPRRRRDEAAAELGRWLVRVRRLAEGIYGDGADDFLGLGGRVSQRPVVLLRQARRAAARLADADLPRPAKLFATASVDESEWLARLRPPVATLDLALGEVASGVRRAESTLAAKQAALAAYDVAFGRLARFLESLFTLAGSPSFAARLRPPAGAAAALGTRRGPGQTAGRTAPRAQPADLTGAAGLVSADRAASPLQRGARHRVRRRVVGQRPVGDAIDAEGEAHAALLGRGGGEGDGAVGGGGSRVGLGVAAGEGAGDRRGAHRVAQVVRDGDGGGPSLASLARAGCWWSCRRRLASEFPPERKVRRHLAGAGP